MYTSGVSIKTFCKMGSRNSSQMIFLIYKQLEKYQNEYYPDNPNLINFCRRVSLQVLMFPISLIKSNYIENDKLLKEKFWPFFMMSKIEICFTYNTFVNKEIFFQEYIEIFHNI